MGIDIKKELSSANTTACAGRAIEYIVIHYTAGTSSKKGNALANAQWFGNSAAQASADFVVDDETIYQVNPDIKNRYCWAVGGVENAHNSKAGAKLYGIAKNKNCISIEICSNNTSGKMTYANDPKYLFTDKELELAVELTKYLMQTYGISADHVIRHYDVNGKLCPGIYGWNAESGSEETWIWFKSRIRSTAEPVTQETFYRVRKTWSDASSQIGAYTVLENAKANCPSGYCVYDETGNEVYSAPVQEGLQATSLNGLTESEKIEKMAPLYQEVMKKTGMLASVGLAQFCLESGYGTTDLAQNANNLHGMKCSLSGNTWEGTSWDGVSKYGKYSPEVYNGVETKVYSEFRKYARCEDSIADRAAYFIGAMNGTSKRYPGINQITDWKKQAVLIKAGGYATDPNYVSKIESLVTRFSLFKYDDVEVDSNIPVSDILPVTEEPWYRVRLKWSDASGQIGAYHDLEKAKSCADNNPGYSVFDEDGNSVYSTSAKIPYLVKVTSAKVAIYTGPSISYAKTGATTGIGKFTIVEEKKGKVNAKGTKGTWGRLKSGAGWIRVGTSTVKKIK